MNPAVRTEVVDGVLTITLDRPKANAIDVTTSLALHAAFVRLQQDPALRVAIITGTGRFFSAGWDLSAAVAGEAIDADHGPGGFAGLTEFFALDKPVIAAVNGLAIGGGFELALAADLIVAAEHAEFFLPEAALGLIADNATIRLPRVVPPNIAREMLISGRRMSAAEAQSWGIVNQVTTSADLMPAARRLAEKICLSAPLSVAAVLELMRELETVPKDDAMPILRRNQTYRAAIDSQDAQEGALAYAEKRMPKWQGK